MTVQVCIPDWPAPATISARQSLRAGGVSAGPYASLNLGLHVGDSLANVQANRRQLVDAWDLPGEPCWLEQVHGTRIVNLDQDWSGAADGAVTARPGVVCVIMTADCLPILLADRRGSRVGAVHAGWRGLAAGVIPAAVTALGIDPNETIAWLGPAIGPGAYEVGAEVKAAFEAVEPELKSAFAPNASGRWQADLYQLARFSLRNAGVESIFGGDQCTYSAAERYFSHRREAPCGRMASMIWIDPT